MNHCRNGNSCVNPEAFLFRIARNLVMDEHRRNSKAPISASGQTEVESDDFKDETESQDLDLAVSACLLNKLTQLPNQYREALLMVDVDGLSQVEAANKLGLSHSGMKSRVQQARRLLKESLFKECQIETDRLGHIMDCNVRSKGSI